MGTPWGERRREETKGKRGKGKKRRRATWSEGWAKPRGCSHACQEQMIDLKSPIFLQIFLNISLYSSLAVFFHKTASRHLWSCGLVLESIKIDEILFQHLLKRRFSSNASFCDDHGLKAEVSGTIVTLLIEKIAIFVFLVVNCGYEVWTCCPMALISNDYVGLCITN
jgi:hypothetical protein